MNEKKFDPKKLKKLNNPQRLKDIPPKYIWNGLNMEETDIIVEIGAGTAFFSIAFLEIAGASKLYACDVSEIMIEWVKANIVPAYPNIIPLKTEENSICLDDNLSDLVFMINLHHELDNPDFILKESYRILKPGKKVFIVDWKKKEMADGPPMAIRYLPEKVREQMLQAGFKQVEIDNELANHFLIVGEK